MQKKNLFGILILIAYFASCNQIHKTHYENGWYHILSQQKDSIAKESFVTVKDFVSLRMDSDENGTCVIVGQTSKHKLKKWAKETEKAIGKHIAFVLDDTVITNPKENARIENGVFQISLPHGYDLKNIYNKIRKEKTPKNLKMCNLTGKPLQDNVLGYIEDIILNIKDRYETFAVVPRGKSKLQVYMTISNGTNGAEGCIINSMEDVLNVLKNLRKYKGVNWSQLLEVGIDNADDLYWWYVTFTLDTAALN